MGQDKTRQSPEEMAALILEGLGGRENVMCLENCITRLRVELLDPARADEKKLMAAGCMAVLGCGTNMMQLVIGLGIQPVADALDACLER